MSVSPERLEAIKKWRADNPDKVRATKKKYDSNHRNANRIVSVAKSNAKKRGLEFDLRPEDITIPDVCPCFKTPFEYGTWFTASIDRIDTSKGYVKGNVQIISKLANTMKHHATEEQLKQFAEWILNGCD